MSRGLDPGSWTAPTNEDLDGLLSDGEPSPDPHVPSRLHPGHPTARPDMLSRDSSKNSGLVSRGSSKASNRAQETQRLVEGLGSFRAKLAASQRQTLLLLDGELEKAKRLQNVTERLSQRSSPERKSEEVCKVDTRSPRHAAGSPRHAAGRFRFPSAFSRSEDSLGPPKPKAPSLPGKEAPPTLAQTYTVPLPSTSVAMTQRKRRMSWIHKQASMDDIEASEVEEPVPMQPVETELEENVMQSLSRDAKQKGKNEKLNHGMNNGLLAQLNPDVAKENVRNKAVAEFGRKPTEIFRKEGPLASVALHPLFEKITMSVIFLNAIWIGIDIELNDADILVEADPGFILAENLFCTFFFAELSMRFFLYTRTIYAFKDIWFLFDLFLVILMIVETWVMPLIQLFSANPAGAATGGLSVLRVARVMRVLRTARMARLVRLMPELMILVKGMMVAFRSVFFTLVLLLLVTYVFAVAFMQFTRGTTLETTLFSSMGSTVSTLILKCIITDQESLLLTVGQESWVMATLLVVFILVGSLTVMNMLLGVLVEAINTVSSIEREQLEVDFAKRVLWDMISKGEADANGDNRISEEEYMKVLRKPEAYTALTSLDVDVEAALEYGKLLFEDGEPLTFGDFMGAILTLRGSNQTTVKDMVDLRKFTADEFSQVHEILSGIGQFLATQAQAQGQGAAAAVLHPALLVCGTPARRHSLTSHSSCGASA